MLVRLCDKLMFAVALIITLQVPQLADHYQQHLAGLYQATQFQVIGYRDTAKKHGFSSVATMIERHLSNTEPSVRTDAQQKRATLSLYTDLSRGMQVFKQGNFFEKLVYMFSPQRFTRLKNTLDNFKLGIPLTFTGIAFGVVCALLINQLLMLPYTFYTWRKQLKKRDKSRAKAAIDNEPK
jgi:hypothetical protein